ncbi:MAG TPA: dTDP-4-dehydrorhamnose 3,5-epimerase [Candidatus Omnitrophota bacterium]|nr:dTDP-4-dehydrorhamnose 3,5-epimerase [Candidatus Omnitrophota bacterium]HQL41474.1 dTDP-4-dehydrorhamnose 3,5-epimerase [Candidatus Omnitrophota bacterium]
MPFTFHQLNIPGPLLIDPVVFHDERGFFKEVFKLPDFLAFGVKKPLAQINRSHSRKNVLRGLHYQKQPFAQAKLIQVLAGKIFDVAVDIRRGSPYYGQWAAVTLQAQDHQMLFIPEGFAHGFVALSDEAQIEYYCSDIYSPAHERGIAYHDPQLKIAWPVKDPVLSPKDTQYPLLKDSDHDFTYEE